MAGARPLRDNPYTGPSRMAVPFPAEEPETSTPPAATGRPKAAPRPSGRADGKGGGSDAAPATSRPPAAKTPATSTRPSTNWTPPTVVSDVSGFVLGLLVWGWVVLPFLQHGPSGPRDVLRAKFLNKAPDGSWLP